MKLRYPEIDYAFTIHNIFLEWNPYEKHDMGLIIGIFLEKLTHHFLKKICPNEKIYYESKIIIDNYKSIRHRLHNKNKKNSNLNIQPVTKQPQVSYHIDIHRPFFKFRIYDQYYRFPL